MLINIKLLLIIWISLTTNFFCLGQKSIVSRQELAARYVISNATIFNGRDSILIPNQDVFVNKGRIEKITETNTRSYEGYDLINGTNKYLMPGLIDAHIHIHSNGSTPWSKKRVKKTRITQSLLFCGITTVFDLGGNAKQSEKLRRKAKKERIFSPDLYFSHYPITISDSHPLPASRDIIHFPLSKLLNSIIPIVENKEMAKIEVGKYVKRNVDFVKIICDEMPLGSPVMSFEILKSIIEETHSLNYKAVVHVGSSENAINAIKAGADVLAHGIYRGKLSEEDAKFIAESKIPIIYTLFVFELSAQLTEGIYNPTQFDSLLLDQKILKGITTNQALQIKNYPVIHAITSNLLNERENWRSNLDLLRKFGAKIIVGTDSGTPGLEHGTAIYHEIDELLKYGLTNYEVLRAATYLSSSTYMDKPSFGFLNEGFEADMLLLNNNPLQEINAVKYPSLIFTNGLIFKRN